MKQAKKYIITKWCGLLMAILAAMGLNSCHKTQKITVDNDNKNRIDTLITEPPEPPKIRDGGDIICLYGVPKSNFQKIEQKNE